MMDDKKIEEAKEEIFEDKFLFNGTEVIFNYEDEYKEEMYDSGQIKEAISLGAKWAINEFLKDLFHPSCEVPRNDNGRILAFSKKLGYRKLYDMNDMLEETDCYTYQDMWENEVNEYCLSEWIFVDELFDLITKGGKL